jgi:hypothetical protein
MDKATHSVGRKAAKAMPFALRLKATDDDQLLALCSEWRAAHQRFYSASDACATVNDDDLYEAAHALDVKQHRLFKKIAGASPSTLRGFRAQIGVVRQVIRDFEREGAIDGTSFDDVLDHVIYRILGWIEAATIVEGDAS